MTEEKENAMSPKLQPDFFFVIPAPAFAGVNSGGIHSFYIMDPRVKPEDDKRGE